MAAPHLEAFLETARYFIGVKENGPKPNTFKAGDKGNEIFALFGYGAGIPWCAIFVSACAIKAGIGGVIIGKSTYARGVCEDTRDNYGGLWIDGPHENGGNAVIPEPGDLILFYTGPGYHDRHVGLVEYADPATNTVTTIEGNASNACKRNEYKADYSNIIAYVRPNWAAVGDDVPGYISNDVVLGPLYQNRNDRHDMTLRQVGYLNNRYALSNNPSTIAVSIINYTSVLGDLYDLFAPAVASLQGQQVDTSQLSGNIKITVDFLLKMGFSASTACALAGCLQTYSYINPAFEQKKDGRISLYGIGAWERDKLNEMQSRIGGIWKTNLSGQLEYFIYDLVSKYNSLVMTIKMQPLNAETAEHVAISFMKVYNRYFTNSSYIDRAKAYASENFNKLIISSAPMVGNAAENLKDINGNQLTAQYSVDIPGSVPQTGIIDDFTSYSYWYNRWNKTSPQRKLAVLWGDQGYPSDKGVATIGGYYCVAVRPKYGKCGEVIVVTLQNGLSFPAIICDEKGADAGSEWGHVKGGGKISLIEWQRVKTINGKIVTSGIGNADVDPRGFNDWYGQAVTNITNYGVYTAVSWG